MFEGAIKIGATGENASDEGGFIIDPGGGENISTSKAGKFTAIINGMTHDETIHVKQQGQKDDAGRFIIDPGGGENIDEGSWRKAHGVTQCTGNKEKLLGINDNDLDRENTKRFKRTIADTGGFTTGELTGWLTELERFQSPITEMTQKRGEENRVEAG